MKTLEEVAPAFVEMAHGIVWCSAATVDAKGRPRSRILHPIWEWDGTRLTGWIATGATPTKLSHLEASPFMSCNYWSPAQNTCVAECGAEWALDGPTRERVWKLFAEGPEPVGYDPAMIPGWDNPQSPGFAVLKLDPWRLRVMPASVLLQGRGETLVWQRS